MIRSVLLFIAGILCASASMAASLQLPVSYFNPICGHAPVNEQTATGFSLDGNYVYVLARGYTSCGSSGRGGGSVAYHYWCDQLEFDLSGILVQVIPIETGDFEGFSACPWYDPHGIYSNDAGYIEWTLFNWNETLTEAQLGSP